MSSEIRVLEFRTSHRSRWHYKKYALLNQWPCWKITFQRLWSFNHRLDPILSDSVSWFEIVTNKVLLFLSLSSFFMFYVWIMSVTRYAGLYFCICVDISDNNLFYLEAIHNFVEVSTVEGMTQCSWPKRKTSLNSSQSCEISSLFQKSWFFLFKKLEIFFGIYPPTLFSRFTPPRLTIDL